MRLMVLIRSSNFPTTDVPLDEFKNLAMRLFLNRVLLAANPPSFKQSRQGSPWK